MNYERGGAGEIILVALAIALLFFILSFFKTENSFYDEFNLTGILRLSCGVTIERPQYAYEQKAVFPIFIEGYANGCGWQANGSSAGTAQVFDGKGLPVTKPATLVIPSNSTKLPYSFTATLPLLTPPTTDTGSILLTSSTGLISYIPIAF